MAEHQLPKLTVRVRFPSSAPTPKALVTRMFRDQSRNRKSPYPVAVPSTCPELPGLPRFSSWTMASVSPRSGPGSPSGAGRPSPR